MRRRRRLGYKVTDRERMEGHVYEMDPPIDHPLRFEPILMERIWGGDTLGRLFGRTEPGKHPIGESWELVDRPEANSRVAAGPLAGVTLGELMARDAMAVVGQPTDRFPLLVKLIDARARLSLQVHPPTGVAGRLGGEPKTEMWHVVHSEPGARIFAGLRPGVSVEDLAAAVNLPDPSALLVEYPTHPGDVFFIPSGLVHALDAGNVVIEIQQNSDTTYRLHDWGRVRPDGHPRDLHLADALASVRTDLPPARVEPTPAPAFGPDAEMLVRCPSFETIRCTITDTPRPLAPADDGCRIVIVLEGDGRIRAPARAGNDAEPAQPGTVLLVPAACAAGYSLARAGDSPVRVLESWIPGPAAG